VGTALSADWMRPSRSPSLYHDSEQTVADAVAHAHLPAAKWRANYAAW